MAQLLISMEPGIFVMADVAMDAGKDATDEIFIKISQNAKFAAVRSECHNMGYFHDGDQPPTPVSPVDASEFSPQELLWIPLLASVAAPADGFIPGQLPFPNIAPYLIGKPLVVPYEHYFDEVSGAEVEQLYAFDKGNQNSQVYKWGVSLMFCISQRLSVAPALLQSQLAGGGSGSSGGAAAGGAGIGSVSGGGPAAPVASAGMFPPDAVVALAPSVQGNFSVAHGLGTAPRLVIIEMTSDGAIWKQNPESDATNLLLTASAGGITGNARCWL